jgi:hypothetical protein
MRKFAVSRKIPVGGSFERPRYQEKTKVFWARSGAEAARAADDWQAEEKFLRWGRASQITDYK